MVVARNNAKSLKTQLSEANLRAFALPDGRDVVMLHDEELTGLALRVGRRSRTWYLTYRVPGGGRAAAPRSISLGRWPQLSVREARKAARALRGDVARGEDPAAERREQRRRERTRVRALLEEFERHEQRRGIVKVRDRMASLRRHLDRLLDQEIEALDRRVLMRLVDAAHDGSGPGAAYDLRKHLNVFMNWAEAQGHVPMNPIAGVRRPRATRAQRLEAPRRGGPLDDGALQRVWHAADATTPFGALVRFLLLTGCRRGEAASLAWDQIDREAGWITIPPQHTKQGRAHHLPVTGGVARLLDGAPRTRSPLVFPSLRNGGPISGWDKRLKQLRAETGRAFTFHDLRRTVRTGLSRLGVPTDIAELCIGHQRDELMEIYDHHLPTDRIRSAFAVWDRHVTSLVYEQKSFDHDD